MFLVLLATSEHIFTSHGFYSGSFATASKATAGRIPYLAIVANRDDTGPDDRVDSSFHDCFRVN